MKALDKELSRYENILLGKVDQSVGEGRWVPSLLIPNPKPHFQQEALVRED
jgi:hypothetical protein